MKKDTVEILTEVGHGIDPDGVPVVVWNVQGKYRPSYGRGKHRHRKTCAHWRGGPCTCKHRDHQRYDPTGEGSGTQKSCAAKAANPEPTPTSGNSTMTTEDTPSSSRSGYLLQKRKEEGVAAPQPSKPSDTAEPAEKL